FLRELILFWLQILLKWLFVMLVNWHDPDHIYLVCGKTDMRKGIDGLVMVIAENYGLELYSNSLFLFCGGRNDRFKGLFWDGEGFIMLYKRFEK
ncbi:IS66 family insertion sequence element accessory protein TnpB, partial [Limosilactobacillus reuteri]|uniref:IS66 family insertion sequence element accessory protein TnpB n=1 Tax=Limosilactobacillus reuteri TaxID=1598 RepID=UPI001E38A5EE